MLPKGAVPALVFCMLLLLAACEPAPITMPVPDSGSSPQASETEDRRAQATTAVPDPTLDLPPVPIDPTPVLEPTAVSKPPTVVEYNLGESTILQEGHTAEDPFNEMPLRLDGVLGVPSGTGTHPLVLILHGDHLGCPPDPQSDRDRWPCTREQEQLNYRGFAYLVEDLAAQGYVALAINANAEYTTGYGESDPGRRLSQIIDLHLGELIEASQGEENPFGVDLYGRIDSRRVAWIAHSSAAELANKLIRDRHLEDALTAAYSDYGPLYGLLQIAPTLSLPDSLPAAGLPLAVILPACDGMVTDLAGQTYLENARDNTQRDAPLTTVLLEAANHNQFNDIVTPDMYSALIRPHCRLEDLLSPADQRAFLSAYALDFLASLFGTPQESAAATANLGLDPTAAVPRELFGRQALLTLSPPPISEELLLRPFSENEMSRNLLGGVVAAENIQMQYCPPGTNRHEADAALDQCHRLQANHPGSPAQLLVSWQQPGAALRLSLPPEGLDIHSYAALGLRAALDPLSPLNEPGKSQSFTVRLTDTQGRTETAVVPTGSPALAYPQGEIAENNEFTGHVHMNALRFPLHVFNKIDLTSIREIGLHFDQSDAGALFIADLGFVRPLRFPGTHSTLLLNDGSLDKLRGIGRFHGTSSCTASLIDTGVPDAPAVVLTNGHCAQNWAVNDVIQDIPAADMQMVFNYFANTRAVQIAVPATRVLYSTMKDRDVAFVELDITLGELQNRDITPFALASQAPDGPREVSLIGAPIAELPSDAAYLRRENCASSASRAAILEHEWLFSDTYRLDCQDVYGGSSGSPIFIKDSDEIFAIVNTSTIGGRVPCALNAPCEITAAGASFSQDTSYGTPVDGLNNCFSEDGRFDLTSAGCPLDGGRQLQISGSPQHAMRPTITLADGSEMPTFWNASLSGDLPFYRYKIGPIATTDCRVDQGYSGLYALSGWPSIDEPLPDEEGFHVLCLLAGPGPQVDETWQPPRFATAVRVEIDKTPPSSAPTLAIRTAAEELVIEANYDPPELAAIRYKSGPIFGTDCADRAGYIDFARRPLTLSASDLPALLCVIGLDDAGNAGQPVRQIVDAPS